MMNSSERAKISTMNLSKSYGHHPIFQNVNVSVSAGESLAITGRNGSGKSSLLRLIANVAEPTAGTVEWWINGRTIDETELTSHIGFVAPYLTLYTEFTAWEHVILMQDLRGLSFDQDYARSLFVHFDLDNVRNEILSTFSSGMMQRAKIICALIHRPTFLLLDEPTTNLDPIGITSLRAMIQQDADNRVTVIATNDEGEASACTHMFSIETQ